MANYLHETINTKDATTCMIFTILKYHVYSTIQTIMPENNLKHIFGKVNHLQIKQNKTFMIMGRYFSKSS